MNLTEDVLAFQAGALDWNHLWIALDRTAKRMLSHWLPDEDTCSDFLDQFHERLVRMVRHFRYKGKEFEALLYSSLKFQVRSWSRRKKENESFMRNYFEFSPGDEIRPSSPSHEEQIIANLEPLPQKGTSHLDSLGQAFPELSAKARRALLIALRNPASLDDRRIALLARYCGLDEEWLFKVKETLRLGVLEKLDRIRKLNATIQSQQVAESMDEKASCRMRMSGSKASIPSLRRQKQQVRPFPLIQEIADCLGVPKGTISSSLYYARQEAMGPAVNPGKAKKARQHPQAEPGHPRT